MMSKKKLRRVWGQCKLLIGHQVKTAQTKPFFLYFLIWCHMWPRRYLVWNLTSFHSWALRGGGVTSVVRALDLYNPEGPEFKSSPLPLERFVFGGISDSIPPHVLNNQLINLPSAGIWTKRLILILFKFCLQVVTYTSNKYHSIRLSGRLYRLRK